MPWLWPSPPLSMWGEGIIKGKLPRTLSLPLSEGFEEEDGGGDGDVEGVQGA